MPWEKSFDIDEATDKAIEVFWKKGFEATSMSDLTQAMQINKGSLYNAFGSKKELFDRALLRYDQQNRGKRLAELRSWSDPVAAIEALFDGLIDAVRAQPASLGCFVVNTAQDLPNQPRDIAEMVKDSLSDVEAFFRDSIVSGQKTGVIDSSIDAAQTASGLLSLFIGMRVLSRGAGTLDALEATKTSAMRLISN